MVYKPFKCQHVIHRQSVTNAATTTVPNEFPLLVHPALLLLTVTLFKLINRLSPAPSRRAHRVGWGCPFCHATHIFFPIHSVPSTPRALSRRRHHAEWRRARDYRRRSACSARSRTAFLLRFTTTARQWYQSLAATRRECVHSLSVTRELPRRQQH